MAKQHGFAVNPSVSITRSRFKRTSQHKTSFNLGDIVPFYVDEVLPGDSRSLKIADLIRMSNPIAPIMDNIQMDFYAFFCPNRILWNHWKEFMGENTTAAGAVSPTAFSVPKVTLSTAVGVGSIGDYFGIPAITGISISELPLRMYTLVYNEWFRDQNVISPIPIGLGDASQATQGITLTYNQNCFKAGKLSDYFTRALPYAQKGSPVTLPLGSSAPVRMVALSGAITTTDSLTLSPDNAISTLGPRYSANALGKTTTGDQVTLNADLAGATAATVNDLRFAFQYQKMLEKDALYGTRYWEILKAHFGVEAPDASLQRPQYLGHYKQMINVTEVTQTTGIDQTPSGYTNNQLGKVAAKSATGGANHLFNQSFTEHGYIMVVGVARHDQTYGQGLNRMWSRTTRTDYYWPVFANLGAQKVLNKEIYAQGTSADDLVFGYQEAWAEYRYKPSIVSGILNPSRASGLPFWTLANDFQSLPTLGQTFIEQDRNNIERSLSTASSGPDFIIDTFFEDIAVRPMPLYSVPGLLDHH